MRKFKDRDAREYAIDLPIGEVMRVRSDSGGRFNLFELGPQADGKSLAETLRDIPTFWELLWFLVEPQATEAGVDARAFGRAMAGDCLIAARLAFFAEWRDFFLSLQQPEAAAALEAMAAVEQKGLELLTARLKDVRIRAFIDRQVSQLEQTLSANVGSLLESSDLTPAA